MGVRFACRRGHKIHSMAISICLMFVGCYGSDVKKVWSSGGTMDEIGLGILLKDQIYFGPDATDKSFADAFPSLLRLQVASLSFNDAPITDASIPYIQKLPKVRFLSFLGTKVTPAGLKNLGAMPKLKHVRVGGPGWDSERALRLGKQLPGVEVEYYWWYEEKK